MKRLHAFVKSIVFFCFAGDIVLRRVALLKRIIYSEEQSQRSGDDHQDHGRKDADIGQADCIFFHSVHHGRNADKMLRLIIIPLVFL